MLCVWNYDAEHTARLQYAEDLTGKPGTSLYRKMFENMFTENAIESVAIDRQPPTEVEHEMHISNAKSVDVQPMAVQYPPRTRAKI